MASVNRKLALGIFAVLVVATPLLFGAVDRIFQIALTLLLGVGFLASPPALPKISRGLKWTLFLFLVAVVAKEFLPASWFGVGDWRAALTHDFKLPLPASLNPEPARAVDSILVAAIAGAFFVWARALATEPRNAVAVAWSLCVSGFIFALVCLALGTRHDWMIYGWRYTPGWAGYGPFPNRNHTAAFLAMSALIACGCTVRAARRKHYAALAFGTFALCAIFVALVESKSRGGLIAFCFGLAVFAALTVAKLRTRGAVITALGSLLITAGLLFAFGAKLLARFGSPEEGNLPANLRWDVWHDTIGMWKTAPLFGFGLDTFARLFPFFQTVHLDDQYVLHPESSWLLWLVEFGLLAFAMMVIALLFFLGKNLRGLLASERGFFLRAGAIAALAALLCHSVYDVPAHRWATAGFGLALLAMACPLRDPKTSIRLERGAAFLPLGIAIFWLVPALTGSPAWSPLSLSKVLAVSVHTPTRVSASRLRETLRWFPLDANLHQALGLRELTQGAPNRAWDEFRIADRLSTSWQLPATQAWIGGEYSPGMARHFWGLAIERAGHRAPEIFEMAYAQTAATAPPKFWSNYAREHPQLLAVYAAAETDPAEAKSAYELWWQSRATASDLDPFEHRYFYISAERYGTRAQLETWIQSHPDLATTDFKEWARLLHRWHEDAAAWKVLAQSIKEPDFPPRAGSQRIEELEATWLTNPEDAVNAQALASEFARRGEADRSLRVIAEVAERKNAPLWFVQKAAWLHAGAGDSANAVRTILRQPLPPRPGARGQDVAEAFEPRVYSDRAGRTMPYRLLKPQFYRPEKSYPLVLYLHGSDERGHENASQLRNCMDVFVQPENRRRFPCFVLAPQCPAQSEQEPFGWAGVAPDARPYRTGDAPAEPERLAMEIVAAVQAEFNVDKNRVYVFGISMGGFGVWDLIMRSPGKFAAALPICGGGEPDRIASAAQLPLWAFHGTNDQAVPVVRTREMIEALRRARGTPRFTEYPGVAHDAWNHAFEEPDLLPWLFSQSRR